eukprot:gene26097-31962_t
MGVEEVSVPHMERVRAQNGADVVEQIDVQRQLCKLAEDDDAWGLPHLLACVNSDGIDAILMVLQRLPASVLSVRSVLDDNSFGEQCTVSILASLQGPSVVRRFSAAEGLPPALYLQADIQIAAPKLEPAIDCFCDIVLQESRALDDEPRHVMHYISIDYQGLKREQGGPEDEDDEEDGLDAERDAQRERFVTRHLASLRQRTSDVLSNSPVFELKVIEKMVRQQFTERTAEVGASLQLDNDLGKVEILCSSVAASLAEAQLSAMTCEPARALLQAYAFELRHRYRLPMAPPMDPLGDVVHPHEDLHVVLDIGAAQEAHLAAHSVPAAAIPAAPMLQYAVDTGLDDALQEMYVEVTEPPMVANPFPRLMWQLHTHAFRLQAQIPQPEALTASVHNDLWLVRPEGCIYAACAPGAREAAGSLGYAASPRGSDPEDDDADTAHQGLEVVYGLFAAVTFVHCPSAHACSRELKYFMQPRRWQRVANSKEIKQNQLIFMYGGDKQFQQRFTTAKPEPCFA